VLVAVDASIAGQSPRPSRPEEIRRLVKERLAGEPAPAAPPPSPPGDSTERDADPELRRWLITFAGKIDQIIAYATRVGAERDALAARAERAARLQARAAKLTSERRAEIARAAAAASWA
jgi:hypothetical protein